MSTFIGPNMYLIESPKTEGLYLNLDGGNKADGTKVVTKWVFLGGARPSRTIDRITNNAE